MLRRLHLPRTYTRAKPAAAKGRYLHTVTLTTSMSPGVRIDPTRTRDIVEDAREPAEVA